MSREHIEEGTMRALLDNSLSADEALQVEKHCRDCRTCEQRQQQLRGHAVRVADCFSGLAASEDANRSALAWARFQSRREGSVKSMTGWMGMRRLSWAAGAIAAACLIVVFTMAPVRLWAEQLLSIFRVQHIAVLDLDQPEFSQNPNGPQFNEKMGKALSDQITVTQKPTRPEEVADQAAAERLAGFHVRLIDGRTPAKLTVVSGAAMSMKLNQERLQGILDEAGRGDIQIPSAVEGATIAVRIPASVTAEYGECGGMERAGRESCLYLLQIPSPVVSAPPQIDPAELAQVALEVAGMKPEAARAYTQTIDWASTLVLPMPRGFATNQQVRINGNEGLLLRFNKPRSDDHFVLVWLDNGIVYSLAGRGDDAIALNLAEDLH